MSSFGIAFSTPSAKTRSSATSFCGNGTVTTSQQEPPTAMSDPARPKLKRRLVEHKKSQPLSITLEKANCDHLSLLSSSTYFYQPERQGSFKKYPIATDIIDRDV